MPLRKDIIRQAAEELKSEFLGFINSSLSPTSDAGTLFDGYYNWLRKGRNTYSLAYDIIGVLTDYGFIFSSNRKSNSKLPCVIVVI